MSAALGDIVIRVVLVTASHAKQLLATAVLSLKNAAKQRDSYVMEESVLNVSARTTVA